MGKIEKNKKEKKDALLNTAFDLFTTKGINKTSISDIVTKAGVAKGTFYLYFSDKYDIRNKLISHKASQLFYNANAELEKTTITNVEDKVIFIVNHILNQLIKNKSLLIFISKNLGWGVFKSALISPKDAADINFYNVYNSLLEESHHKFIEPEIMIYTIIELVGASCYSPILYNEPVPIEKYKPYMFESIRNIIKNHCMDE